jgi:hypothetical protein
VGSIPTQGTHLKRDKKTDPVAGPVRPGIQGEVRRREMKKNNKGEIMKPMKQRNYNICKLFEDDGTYYSDCRRIANKLMDLDKTTKEK